jgi:hypothetical protein
MTNLIRKGGKFIIQNDGQKGSEATCLDFFMQTLEGKKWLHRHNIVNKISEESPDFIFETSTGKTIGLEITNLVIKTDKYHATATLNTIASQVCQHFKKEKDIALSLLIEIYDERKRSWRTKKEYLDYIYNPGFDRLDVPKKKIKDAIIAAISKEDVPIWGLRKEWIDLSPHKFVITYDRMHEPHTSHHVNNAGMCKQDPFEELQDTINSKNEKYAAYKTRCDECDLLVVSDDGSTGNFAFFTDKIKSYRFISSFKNVYLLDLGMSSAKTIKLKTKPVL